jgi:hypothetical protein
VLGRALAWRLTPVEWQAVDGAVGRLAAAAAGGDAEGFRQEASDLEFAGPRKGVTGRTPPDAEPARIPVPGPLRERIYELIHQVGGQPVEPSPPDAGVDAPG